MTVMNELEDYLFYRYDRARRDGEAETLPPASEGSALERATHWLSTALERATSVLRSRPS